MSKAKAILLSLAFAFSAAIPAGAQTISNITVRAVSMSSFLVEYDASAVVTDFLVEYDTVATPPFQFATWKKVPVNASATTNGIQVTGLAPATTYYWRLKTTISGTTVYSPVQSTQTAAETADRFRDPTLPSTPAGPVYPASYATTLTATSCADIQTKINAAAAATGAGDVKLIIPASFDCAGAWTFPAKAGAGVVVVTTDAPASAIPPAGVRASFDWEASMPKLRIQTFDPNSSTTFRWQGVSNGWIFRGIELTEAFPSAGVKPLAGATGGVYTVNSHGYSTGDVVQICNAGTLTRNAEITVTGTNTFTLTSQGTTGTCPNGSWVAREISTILSLVWMDTRSTNIWFDQCLFKLSYWMPTSARYGVNLWCTQCGVVNSYFRDVQGWRPYNTRTGTAYSPPGCCYGETILVGLSHTTQSLVENNTMESPGITIFAEEVDGLSPNAGDITIRRNVVNWRDEYRLGSPTSLGYRTPVRQPLEFKRCERCLVEGNIFRNQWTDGTTGNSANGVVMTPRCSAGSTGMHNSVNRIQDITIRNNRFESTEGMVNLLGGETTDRACDVEGTKRVLIRNNVATAIDGSKVLPGLNRVWGNLYYFSGGLEDVVVENNTSYAQTGTTPAFLVQLYNRSSGLKVRNNLAFMNNDNTANGVSTPYATSFVPPLTTTTAVTKIAGLWFAAPNADTRTEFRNNAVVPLITNTTSTANYTNPSYLLAYSTCNNVWGGLVTCVATNETTGVQRLLLPKFLDAANGDLGLRHDSPFASGSTSWICPLYPTLCVQSGGGANLGADTLAVDAAVGKVRNVRVVTAGRTSAVIGYTRPADKSCTVEYGTQAVMGTGSRVADSGSTENSTTYVPVTVTLPGLAAGTQYYYRVLCPAEQPTGSFFTLP